MNVRELSAVIKICLRTSADCPQRTNIIKKYDGWFRCPRTFVDVRGRPRTSVDCPWLSKICKNAYIMSTDVLRTSVDVHGLSREKPPHPMYVGSGWMGWLFYGHVRGRPRTSADVLKQSAWCPRT